MNHTVEITQKENRPIEELVAVWQASVAATHSFLSAQDIEALLPEVTQSLADVEHMAIAFAHDGTPLGFVGTENNKIEMLFIHPACRGFGLGKQLAELARKEWAVKYVDVNEQNTQAVGFYEKLGFTVASREDTDSEGRPFPILHMVL